jgi:hypothetical protein
MQTFWSRGQVTLNEVDNNLEIQKSGLKESWPKGSLVPKNPRYWKKTWNQR